VIQRDDTPGELPETQFTLIQRWIANTPGRHVVTVRATDSENRTGQASINVNVANVAPPPRPPPPQTAKPPPPPPPPPKKKGKGRKKHDGYAPPHAHPGHLRFGRALSARCYHSRQYGTCPERSVR
jgi:hypothetical protein